MTICTFPLAAPQSLMFNSGRRPSDASATAAGRSISSSASVGKFELVQAILEDMSSKASTCTLFGDYFGYTCCRTCCRDSRIMVTATMLSVYPRYRVPCARRAHAWRRGHVSKRRRRPDRDIAIKCRPEDQTKESAEEARARPGMTILRCLVLLLKLHRSCTGHSGTTATINVSNCQSLHFFLPQVNTDCTLPCTYEPFFPVACASLAAAMMALKS